MGGAKEWRALAPFANKTETFDAVSLTICSSESWPGSFIAGTAPSFSIKRCANPASNWALFIKRSSTNTLAKLHRCPGKTNCIHCLRNAGFFWEAEQGYLSLTSKNTSLETFFPSESRAAVQPNDACWWAHLISLSRWSMCEQARSSGRNAHIRSFTIIYVIKGHDWKKLSETCTNPEVRFLAQKFSVILPNRLLKLWPCLAWVFYTDSLMHFEPEDPAELLLFLINYKQRSLFSSFVK